MQRVLNFSGGKTSAYMTIKEYKPGDIVIFCDTGREHPKTHKFINDFEAYEKIPIIRLGSKNSFDDLLISKKYKVIPNMMKRFCTVNLKINVAKRYLRSIGIRTFENYIGFRYDEPNRVIKRKEKFKKVFTKFPLYDQKITKEQINTYWESKPYNLEIPGILGNCTLCFMKGQNAIMAILRSFPELAEPWINDEKQAEERSKIEGKKNGSGRKYFKDTTIQSLLDRAQNNLFKDYDLGEISPAYNCSCTT